MTTNDTNLNLSTFTGRGNLRDLVAELERQRSERLDVVIDSRELEAAVATGGKNDGGLVLRPKADAVRAREFLPTAGLPINDLALGQIGSRVSPEIPGRFLKSLAEVRPNRAAELVTGLLNDTGKRNFVRTLDGRVRAFLSDRYRIVDNFDLAFVALDAAKQANAQIIECSLSEKSMRIKMISREVWDVLDASRARGEHAFVRAGDLANRELAKRVGVDVGDKLPGGAGTVFPLISISNSETGHGGINVGWGGSWGICNNSAIIESAVRQIHLGERQEVGVFSEETISADSKAIALKCRDSILAGFDPKRFRESIAGLREAGEDVIKAPTEAVANLVEGFGLSEDAKDGILAHFLGDYKPTRLGLSQAVARYAQDVADGDDASGLEEFAGKIALPGGEKLYA